jgi:hypothetical protein
MEEQVDCGPVTFNCFTYDQWQEKLWNHEPKPLECHFLPKENVVAQTYDFNWKLDLVKLRHAFSRQASISWVKCKKKIQDEEIYIGIKSMFHSLRILNFGIQIASEGRIYDYQQANPYWETINDKWAAWRMYGTESEELWNSLHLHFKPEYNRLCTEFKKLAPKE